VLVTFQYTPKKRSALVAEMVSADEITSAVSNSEQDDSPSPPKRPRQETSDPETISFPTRERIGEDPEDELVSDDGLEDDIRRIAPRAEIAALLSMPQNPRPRRREPIAATSSSVVDAHFSAAWDGFTGRAAEGTLEHDHLPVFEDWHHDLLDHEGV